MKIIEFGVGRGRIRRGGCVLAIMLAGFALPEMADAQGEASEEAPTLLRLRRAGGGQEEVTVRIGARSTSCITPCEITVPQESFSLSAGRVERMLPAAGAAALDIEVDPGWNDAQYRGFVATQVLSTIGGLGASALLLGSVFTEGEVSDWLLGGAIASATIGVAAGIAWLIADASGVHGEVRVYSGERRIASLSFEPVVDVNPDGSLGLGLTLGGRF